MVPKRNRPKLNELRPIALANIPYKLAIAVIRYSIEGHIRRNGLEKDTQVGFTDGGRVENNILILKYCIDQSYKNEKTFNSDSSRGFKGL